MNNTLSNWNHWVSDVQYSPQQFQDAVMEEIKSFGLDQVKFSSIKHGKGKYGKRDYLRVSHFRTTIDIGASPYGNGFFVSYWVTKEPERSAGAQFYMTLANLCRRIPLPFFPQYAYNLFSGIASNMVAKNNSVYVYDDAFMFQQTVHKCIMNVINAVSSEQGVREVPNQVAAPSLVGNAF